MDRQTSSPMKSQAVKAPSDAPRKFHDRVDLFDTCYALLKNKDCLIDHRNQDAVERESRVVLDNAGTFPIFPVSSTIACVTFPALLHSR